MYVISLFILYAYVIRGKFYVQNHLAISLLLLFFLPKIITFPKTQTTGEFRCDSQVPSKTSQPSVAFRLTGFEHIQDIIYAYILAGVLPVKAKGTISRYKNSTPILGRNRNYSTISVTTVMTNPEKVMQFNRIFLWSTFSS